MQEEEKGDDDAELPVEGFVVEGFHAEPGAEAATYGGKAEECGFGYAPCVAAGAVLVHAVGDEGGEVCEEEVGAERELRNVNGQGHLGSINIRRFLAMT